MGDPSEVGEQPGIPVKEQTGVELVANFEARRETRLRLMAALTAIEAEMREIANEMDQRRREKSVTEQVRP